MVINTGDKIKDAIFKAFQSVLPSSQVLSVPISFKRVLEGGFGEDFEKGIQSIIDFSSNFGKMTIR